MTTILTIIILLLFATLAVLSLFCMRLYGKHAAIEKERELIEAKCAELDKSVKRGEETIIALQVTREEQLARIAVLEGEKSVLAERIDTQKEQFKETLEQMRHEFKTMATEALEKNTELFNRHSQERLESLLKPFDNDLKQFREKVDSYYSEESKERFSLKENIKNLVDANRRIRAIQNRCG